MKPIGITAKKPGPPRAVAMVLNVVLALTALAAVAALALEYGFGEQRLISKDYLHIAEGVIVAIFILDRFLRWLLARQRGAYIRHNWMDFALMGAAGVALLISYQIRPKILSAATLYVIITQAYILITLILRGVGANLQLAGSGIHPTWLIIGSFAFLCVAGSGLLMLPVATPEGNPISYIDALFTATSATCVTGLVVRDTGADFTRFGQGVILLLIQAGGLGIMLFGTMLAMLIGKGLSVRGSEAMGQIVAAETRGKLGRTVVFVILVTLIVEIIGAVLFYPMFAHPQAGQAVSFAQGVWDSVFHSVSSFCNAGFSLYGRNMMAGVGQGWASPLRNHWQVMGVMAPLIVLGGLGFPVLQDFASYVVAWVRRFYARLGRPGIMAETIAPRPRLSLHSKVVLSVSAILLILGAVVLLAVEPKVDKNALVIGRHPQGDPQFRTAADWATMNDSARLKQAVFQSVSARTAGFNTIDMNELSDAGKLWMSGLMIIGGSPASTAGGMKTVTLALLVLTVYSVLRRRSEIEGFKRSLPAELLNKSVTLAVLYIALVCIVTMLLCMAMRPGYKFIDLFFEACSACGTVGLSTGVTNELNVFGKNVVTAAMFIGRVGPVTLLMALTFKMRRVEYTYPRENVFVG